MADKHTADENRTDKGKAAAQVDFLVDENGQTLDVPDDSVLRAATGVEQVTGATGPSNWWRLGLVGFAVLIAIVLVLQMMGGNQGTGVIPGTPTAAPQN